MRRKSKFINRRFREIHKKRKKFICKNFGDDEKEQLKKDDKKHRKMCDILLEKKHEKRG